MKTIRDQIHNYIPISPLESKLISQPEFLRLHRVLQNSTLHQTYPSNRNSRFIHSLGSMHVAGMLLKSLIYNSSTDFVEVLHTTVRDFIKKWGGNFFDSLQESRRYLISAYGSFGGRNEFFLTQGWSMGGEIEEFHLFYNTVNNVIFQSVRLAALIHDVGHLPYSHALEFALNDLSRGDLVTAGNLEIFRNSKKLGNKFLALVARRTIRDYKEGEDEIAIQDALDAGIGEGELHEMIGIILMDNLIFEKTIFSESNPFENEFWRVCLRTSIQILLADQMGHYKSDEFALRVRKKDSDDLLKWYCLGNIVSGQVDCDRIDFLLRDSISSGVEELGSFDKERIISGILPIEMHAKDDLGLLDLHSDKTFYMPGFDRRALSALADFFHTRMRQYRWLANHHNVVRTDLALIRLIIRLADIVDKNSDKVIVDLLNECKFNQLWDWDESLKHYRFFDDTWLDNILKGLYREINSNLDKLSPGGIECLSFLQIVYDRKVEILRPIWKRIDEFVPFASGFKSKFYSMNIGHPLYFIEDEPALRDFRFLAETQEERVAELDRIKKLISDPNNSNDSTSSEVYRKICGPNLRENNEVNWIEYTNLILSFWKKIDKHSPYMVMERVENELNKQIENHQKIYLALKTVTPYKKVMIELGTRGEKVELERISSLVASLNQISDRELKLYAFEMRNDIEIDKTHPNSEWDITRKRQLGERVAEILYRIIYEREVGSIS